jgi:glycogen debranching enzyme
VSTLATGLLAALAGFPDARFPELFSGVGRDRAPKPIAYPNANEPQAWASGAVLLLVRALLGLEVDAPAKRVSVRPCRIPNATFISVRNLPVGGHRIAIEVRFTDGAARPRLTGLPADWRVDTD